MQIFADDTGLDSMRTSMLYTTAALKAQPEHAALAKPLEAQIAHWSDADTARRQADDAEVTANACVARGNAVLDRCTSLFGAQLLVDCGQDRTHPSFKAFFPAKVSDTTRLALEKQLDAMKDFGATTVTLTKPAAALHRRVIAAMDAGAAAIRSRGDGERAAKAASQEVSAWRDSANKVRRTAHTALETYAIEQGLLRGYADEFFPSAQAAKKAVEPTIAELVLALPDVILAALTDAFIATLPTDAQAVIRTRLVK